MNSEWDFYLWLEEICLTHSWLDTKQSIDFEVISALLLWSWILLLCHHCKKRLILLCYIKYVCAISHFSPTLWAVGMVSQCMLSSPVVACSFLGLGSTQVLSWAIMKCLGIQVGLCHQFIMKQSFFFVCYIAHTLLTWFCRTFCSVAPTVPEFLLAKGFTDLCHQLCTPKQLFCFDSQFWN